MRAVALAEKRTEDVGFVIFRCGNEDIGVGDTFIEQNANICAFGMDDHGLFQLRGKFFTALLVTLDEADVEIALFQVAGHAQAAFLIFLSTCTDGPFW